MDVYLIVNGCLLNYVLIWGFDDDFISGLMIFF